MNTDINFNSAPRKGAIPGKPSASLCLLFALVSVAAGVILPEMGILAAVALCTAVVYMASARAFFPIMLIPFLGAAGVFVRSGYVACGIVATLIIASMAAGYSVGRGGFHRALMVFTFVGMGIAVGAAAFAIWYFRLSIKGIYEAYTVYMADAVASFIESAGTKLHPDDAKLILGQYDAMSRTIFLYIPVAVAWAFEACAIAALRLAGLFHDITGSIMFPRRRRVHLVNKVFSVVFFASMLVGFADTGIVGVSVANVMLVLAIPAASAGISELRRSIILRRLSGRRGFPFTLLLVILVSLGLSVGVGLLVLGVIGCLPSFKKDPDSKKKK